MFSHFPRTVAFKRNTHFFHADVRNQADSNHVGDLHDLERNSGASQDTVDCFKDNCIHCTTPLTPRPLVPPMQLSAMMVLIVSIIICASVGRALFSVVMLDGQVSVRCVDARVV